MSTAIKDCSSSGGTTGNSGTAINAGGLLKRSLFHNNNEDEDDLFQRCAGESFLEMSNINRDELWFSDRLPFEDQHPYHRQSQQQQLKNTADQSNILTSFDKVL